MSRPIIVLCEDKQHSAFALRFLRKKNRQAKVIPFPAGKGAGVQHVREEYPKQLAAARRKNGALIVIIDGDERGAKERMRELDDACQKQGVGLRQETDTVAVFIPEPDMEKEWINYLDKTKTGKLQRERECATAVKRLLDICDGGGDFPADFPDSLRNACGEWRRFL